MSNGTFLTFPLPLLALPEPEKDRLQIIVGAAIQRAGAAAKIEDDRVNSELERQPNIGFARRENHLAIVRGSIVLGVTIGSIPATLKHCERANSFTEEYESTHGPSPMVFISANLFWGCHNHNEPTYRDWSTLCAVNSVVGFKRKPVLIRRAMIIARQLGHKTPAILQAELRSRKDQTPLTTHQLRDCLDQLEEAGFISRYQASPRRVFFSTATDYDQLGQAVKKSESERRQVQVRREAERAEYLRANGGPLKKGRAESGPLKNEGPNRGHIEGHMRGHIEGH